jgi:hypothetical protein
LISTKKSPFDNFKHGVINHYQNIPIVYCFLWIETFFVKGHVLYGTWINDRINCTYIIWCIIGCENIFIAFFIKSNIVYLLLFIVFSFVANMCNAPQLLIRKTNILIHLFDDITTIPLLPHHEGNIFVMYIVFFSPWKFMQQSQNHM